VQKISIATMAVRNRGKQDSRRRNSPTDGVELSHAESEVRPASSFIDRIERRGWKSSYALIPVLLAILTSINTLWNGFASDDLSQVVNNKLIRQLTNVPQTFAGSVWSFATEDVIVAVDSYYRPMFMSLFTVNYAIFADRAWGWHFINVLIHCAVTLLVFVLLKKITGDRWLSLTTAAIFAVHPVHAESVAWVSGITDPLLALFILPAFYYYLRFKEGGGHHFMGAALLFYFMGLFSKETAVALPLVVVYWELETSDRASGLVRRLARAIALPALFILPTAIYLLCRNAALAGILFGSGPRAPLGPALATIPLALVEYLRLMSVPVGYSYQHFTVLVDSIWNARFIWPFVASLLLLLGVVLSRSRLVRFTGVWFLAMLSPALFAIRHFDPEYVVQERYLYVPSIGFCLAMALGLRWLLAAGKHTTRAGAAAFAAGLVLIGTWGVACARQNLVWATTETLFENCVAQDPGSAAARTALSRILFDSGQVRQAEMQSKMALSLDPTWPGSYLNLSYFAKVSGDIDKSIGYLEQSTSKVPEGPLTRYSLATIYLNLGLLYQQRKEISRAEETLRRSLDLWPRAVGWYYTGQFYFDEHRYEDALRMFDLALDKLPPRFAAIHMKRGLTYDLMGRKSEARAEYQRYLDLAPSEAADRQNVTRRLSQL
jgi:protein O-mannosyl-transferase